MKISPTPCTDSRASRPPLYSQEVISARLSRPIACGTRLMVPLTDGYFHTRPSRSKLTKTPSSKGAWAWTEARPSASDHAFPLPMELRGTPEGERRVPRLTLVADFSLLGLPPQMKTPWIRYPSSSSATNSPRPFPNLNPLHPPSLGSTLFTYNPPVKTNAPARSPSPGWQSPLPSSPTTAKDSGLHRFTASTSTSTRVHPSPWPTRFLASFIVCTWVDSCPHCNLAT
mmetsp:Transcript_8253/g.19227  ORF Transcript_8253/g.19227 Transcript_8253/m.19227 type:complete len:228 (+) Transcript_8253:947-1630(+)